jgi:hypothetical protein
MFFPERRSPSFTGNFLSLQNMLYHSLIMRKDDQVLMQTPEFGLIRKLLTILPRLSEQVSKICTHESISVHLKYKKMHEGEKKVLLASYMNMHINLRHDRLM